MTATHYVLRAGGACSQRIARRSLIVATALALVVVAAGLTSLSVGATAIPLLDIARVLIGSGTGDERLIVVEFRLPRMLAGALVGASLAVSGAIFQGLARNALVSPDVIGISAGAVFAAVLVITTGLGFWLVPYAAFAGALAAALAVYALAFRRGIRPLRLVLVGIGISALLGSGTAYLMTRGELVDVMIATVWTIGSLYGSDWRDVVLLAGNVAILFPLALALARQLEPLELGDDMARALGQRTERTRTLLIVTGVGLVAAAVAVAGAVGFVAFVAPQIARRLLGFASGSLLPIAALVGAALVMLSDIVARTIVAPGEIPVGVFTVLLGAPYFLYLLQRANRLGSTA